MSNLKKLYLIDGNGYIHRAFHGLPPLTNSKGEPVQAIFGFARMILKILRQEKPDYVAVCFDTPAPTFRHKAYAEYKANRKEIDDDLKFQLPLSKDLVELWGIPVVKKEGYEADDVIATLAQQGVDEGLNVVIVTGDKDAFQMVNDHIHVLNEHRNILYTSQEVKKKYGLGPDQLVDYFSLVGDASDNVPGVPGVGPKTATELLQKYGTLDKTYSRLEDLKENLRHRLDKNKKMAFLSRDLVVLDRQAPISLKPKDCVLKSPDSKKLLAFFKRFEFNSFINEVLPQPKNAVSQSREVHVVLTESDLKKCERELKKAKNLAVDVETTGTDPLLCDLVGIALSVKRGVSWYIPVGHAYLGSPKQLSLKKVQTVLRPYLQNKKLPKIGQNLKYDALVLDRYGMPLMPISFDTLIASYCLNPSRMTHNLKQLSMDLLGEPMTSIEELIGKGAQQKTMDGVDIQKVADYAGADAEVVFRLKEKMEPELKIKKLEKLFYDVEIPLVAILQEMEKMGVRVDSVYLEVLQKKFKKMISKLEKSLYDLAGYELNLNSPKQLSGLLFDKLKLPVIRRTKTGFSTDEEVLNKLSPMHEFPAKLLSYRELTKLKSTYIDSLIAQTNPKTKRVHSSFNQAIASTGRLSSSNPNLQNIPIRTEYGRDIRRAFIPEQGTVFLSADYSQIDLRVLAHVSKDPVLCRAFKDGEDIHSVTAREIFDLDPKAQVSDDDRRIAKSVNFGIVYGQTPFGLSQQLGIPMIKAKNYIDCYFEKYSKIKKWVEEILDFARQKGYVTTLLNRVRYLPEIKASNANVRSFAERMAMNTPIQGTSADIIKTAMLDVAALIQGKKWGTKMLLQVHDDLLFEVPKKELNEVVPLIKKKMENAIKLSIPIVVDLKKGKNWADMEKIKI